MTAVPEIPTTLVTATYYGNTAVGRGPIADLSPSGGRVLFTPPNDYVLVTADDGSVHRVDTERVIGIVRGVDGVLCDTNGFAGVPLFRTDTSFMNPNDWTWLVEEQLLNSAGKPVSFNRYSINVTGTTLDLGPVTPVPASSGNAVIVGPAGPAGPRGAAGAGLNIVMIEAAQWSYEHGLGVVPQVQAFDATGVAIIGDVYADTNIVTVTWPSPTAGVLALN